MPPFRALALATWRNAVLDVSIARADGARVATWEKTKMRVSTRLAYSATSSSAEDNIGPACASEATAAARDVVSSL